MTDNEIIKALECCNGDLDCCKECPAKYNNVECGDVLKNNALKLITRQKAEIERLQKTQSDIDNFARELCKERMLKGKAIADFEDLQGYIRKEKSEAIREFAERLKKKTYPFPCAIGVENAVTIRGINDLVKEMSESVKHGEWLGTVCSACGESTSFYYDCDYCPRCGAKMEPGITE